MSESKIQKEEYESEEEVKEKELLMNNSDQIDHIPESESEHDCEPGINEEKKNSYTMLSPLNKAKNRTPNLSDAKEPRSRRDEILLYSDRSLNKAEDRLSEDEKLPDKKLKVEERKQNMVANSAEFTKLLRQSKSSMDTDKYYEFLKEMTETEDQIKKLHSYHQSFNKQMSSKYDGYNIDSDNDEDGSNIDADYEMAHGQDLSSSSEGNLSRDEEEDKTNESPHMIEVSPDSPEEFTDKEKFDEMFKNIMFRDVLNECDYENQDDSSQNSGSKDNRLSNINRKLTWVRKSPSQKK